MVRIVISLVSGIGVGGLVVALIQMIAKNMYPISSELSADQVREALSAMPVGFYWFLIASHMVGAFGAGLLAALINKKNRIRLGMVAVAVILVYTFISNFNNPYPGWAKAADVSLAAISGLIGAWLTGHES